MNEQPIETILRDESPILIKHVAYGWIESRYDINGHGWDNPGLDYWIADGDITAWAHLPEPPVIS